MKRPQILHQGTRSLAWQSPSCRPIPSCLLSIMYALRLVFKLFYLSYHTQGLHCNFFVIPDGRRRAGETKRRLQSGEFPGCAGQAGGGWAVYSGESRGWQVYYILCLPAKRLQAFFLRARGGLRMAAAGGCRQRSRRTFGDRSVVPRLSPGLSTAFGRG